MNEYKQIKRGLLFTGGKQPDVFTALPYFYPYSFVVAADSGLCFAESANIVPDMIVGDMDSIKDLSILTKYPKEKIQIWPKEKNNTDTELALKLMMECNIDEIVLVGGSGGRLDHLLALLLLFESNYSLKIWIGEENIVYSIDPETITIYIIGLDSNDSISIFPLGSGPHSCRGTGLYWEIDNLEWDKNQYSLSNRSDSGMIKLHVNQGRFLIILPLHSGINFTKVQKNIKNLS